MFGAWDCKGLGGSRTLPHVMHFIWACSKKSLQCYCLLPCRPASLSTLAILNSAWKAVEARSKQRSKSAGGILSAQSLPPSTTNSKKGRKERLLQTDSVLAWVWLTQHGCLAHEVSECFYSYFLVICSFFSKRESAVYWSTHSCGGPCNQHTRT